MSCKEEIKFIQRALSGNYVNVKLRTLHNFLDMAVGDLSSVSPFSRFAFSQVNRSTVFLFSFSYSESFVLAEYLNIYFHNLVMAFIIWL